MLIKIIFYTPKKSAVYLSSGMDVFVLFVFFFFPRYVNSVPRLLYYVYLIDHNDYRNVIIWHLQIYIEIYVFDSHIYHKVRVALQCAFTIASCPLPLHELSLSNMHLNDIIRFQGV